MIASNTVESDFKHAGVDLVDNDSESCELCLI